MKKYIAFIVFILIILSGCSPASEDTEAQPTDSRVPIVKINGEIYYSYPIKEGEYTISEEFGEVQKRDYLESSPKENLITSSYFEGTKLFTVEEDEETLLIEVGDEYEILKKRSQ